MKMKNILIICLVFAFCAGCAKQPIPQEHPVTGSPSFFVHLQTGFSGETVRVCVDDVIVYDEKPTTDPLDGFAHEFTCSAESNDIVLRVEIPAVRIDSMHIIDVTKAEGLGISVRNGKVDIVQANAFGYD